MRKAVCFLTFIFVLSISNLGLKANEGWVFKKPMPTARSGICAVVLDGKIYVLGGRDNAGQVLNLVERYDPISDVWETGLPTLKDERENAAAVIYNGRIFVLGGRDNEGKVLEKVELFDPLKNEWESFDDLEESREALAAVVLNDTMYAIGGFGGEDENGRLLNSVEYYDSNQEDWLIFEAWQLEVPRVSLAAVVVKDSAYSIGGFFAGPLGLVQLYNSAVGTAERRELLTPRGSLSATVNNDTIFVMGGRDPFDQVLSSVEFLMPSLNRWQQGLALNTARENFAAVAVNNTIYVIGGLGTNQNALSSVEAADRLEIVTSVATVEPSGPIEFRLKQNYPNPFNAGTKINFQISSKTRDSIVNLSVYNLQGQLIITLVNERLMPGEYEVLWEGTDQKGFPVASGLYIYALKQGLNKETKKMMLIR